MMGVGMIFDFLKPKRVAASLIAKRLMERYGSLSDEELLSKAKYELERVKRRDEELYKYVLEKINNYYGVEIGLSNGF
jgi:hypothetical protein